MQRLNHYAIEQAALKGDTDAENATYYVNLDPSMTQV